MLCPLESNYFATSVAKQLHKENKIYYSANDTDVM